MKATMLVWAVTGGLAVISARGAPGDCDPLFQVGSDLNGEVLSMDLDPQGRLVIGGEFTWVHATLRAGLARLRVDGTVDPDFTPNLANANGWERVFVNFCAVQPDDKLFVAGGFTRVDGVEIGTWFHNLVRLDGAGRVDPGFSAWAGCDGWISGAVTLADGKVIIWGGFSEVNGLPRHNLARLESNGGLDHTFVVPVATGWQSVREVLVQTNDLLLVSAVESDGTSRLLRLAPSGDLDPSFATAFGNEGAPPSIHDVALQGDGSILVSGFFQRLMP